MTLGEHQQAFSRDLVTLLIEAFERGYEVRIGEVERTVDQQKLYVQTGRSKTMNSIHLKKCAADLHFTKDGVLCYPKELGDFWEKLNPLNQWGGNWKSFKDAPHFQRTV
jgi:peptidoglycan L-alanyl-D-glutamate endopeptidase CwlK